jgi:hypothetical protein
VHIEVRAVVRGGRVVAMEQAAQDRDGADASTVGLVRKPEVREPGKHALARRRAVRWIDIKGPGPWQEARCEVDDPTSAGNGLDPCAGKRGMRHRFGA